MRHLICIAVNTHRESLRGKTLYSLFFFALVLLVGSALFGSVTIGDQVKVIKDFGLFSISFFSVLFAVISGSAMLHKELNRRTIYNILAKPVRRLDFIAGKYLGMVVTACEMIAIMTGGLAGFAYLFEGSVDYNLFGAGLCIMFELLIVAAVSVFLSSIVITPLIGGLITFMIFLAGRSSWYVLELKSLIAGSFAKFLIELIYWILPHLDELNISGAVVYGHVPGTARFFWTACYALGYSGMLLLLSAVIFSRKEFI